MSFNCLLQLFLKLFLAGPILQTKGMHMIFQKKGKKGGEMFKKGKTFENFSNNVQNWKYFEKGQVIARDYCTQ